MFEIRAICEPADADRVPTMLSTAFTTGPVRRYPTREGDRVRLYVTADHRPGLVADTGTGLRHRPEHRQRNQVDRPHCRPHPVRR